ncbi:MAG TPA: bifunctional serine/threonine-protein kinase/formylglycine-generating enzyme family protein [Candidatus Cloacimonas acidaminovorans]|nr:bifunctional serine/threonine-protein kinase/formylglycine-generating enzyme family protein [Candidatus Cloacimonas acidaminovorans]
MPETTLNSYQIIKTVHSSLRFSLYQAKQMETGQIVLLKTPDTQRLDDEKLKQDLINEAHTHLKLSHPQIRKVYEIREEKGTAYLIGEYIEGMSLSAYLKINSDSLPIELTLSWLKELLEALSYAHKQECIHLNLNPYNLIVDNANAMHIIGFGKNQDAYKTANEKNGTYHPLLYLAPELFQAGIALPQSDLYSFAVIAYQILCGVVPWRIDLQLSPEKQKQQSLCRAVIMPEILHKQVPDWLFTALLQCLKLDPHQRFANAEELITVFNEQENWLPKEDEKVESVQKVEKIESIEEVEKIEKVEKVEETEKKELPNSQAESSKTEFATPKYPAPESFITEIKETKKLKKTFKILIWLSLIIILFIIVKYIAFDNRPKFTSVADSTQVEISEEPLNENLPIAMVLVPADTLVMGNISPEAEDDEFPLLTIGIPAFYISKKEISQAEWMMVFPNNPAHSKDPELPVENVNFYDIIDFCNQKSILDGFEPCYDYYDDEVVCNFSANGYRLPTEAEWEFAAKGGKRNDFFVYSGSDKADEVGWYNENSDAQSHPSGQKKPNQLGIYDLSGNIFEWVWNWYVPYSSRNYDPYKGPDKGIDKVIRGGSWYHNASEMRVTNRNFAKPYTKNAYLGFRVVRTYSPR